MKFGSVAALFLTTLSLGAEARPEMANVDPENYVAKEVDAETAKGGIRKLFEQGVLSFGGENEAGNEKKGNLRALQGMFNNGGDDGWDDDQLVTEELLTIEYYQDNRFSSPDPIFSSATNPSLDASGNRWIYANVPLQPVFGINDLPIAGLAQGFCESTKADINGFCHFTYEFFDLRDGAIVVYASLTVEGTTRAQGPSVLSILGGTGEFAGAVGRVTLFPVGIDESITPARIFRDDSFFLGNRNGYEAKFDVSLRYLLNEPMPVPVPVAMPVPAPIPQANTLGGGELTQVNCPGLPQSEYCDCNLDCTHESRCKCDAGEACCAGRR